MEAMLPFGDNGSLHTFRLKRHHIFLQLTAAQFKLSPEKIRLSVIIHEHRRINTVTIRALTRYCLRKRTDRRIRHGYCFKSPFSPGATEVKLIFAILVNRIRRIKLHSRL